MMRNGAGKRLMLDPFDLCMQCEEWCMWQIRVSTTTHSETDWCGLHLVMVHLRLKSTYIAFAVSLTASSSTVLQGQMSSFQNVCDVMVVADTVVGVGEIKSEGNNVEVQLQATILKVYTC